MLESESYLKEIIYITLLGDLQLGFMAELETMEVVHLATSPQPLVIIMLLSLSLSKRLSPALRALATTFLFFSVLVVAILLARLLATLLLGY